MKHLSYQAFKQLVMDSTDPKKGTKVALQIRDCHERKLPHLRPLESLKGLRMFIMYRKSRHSNGVIELDSLDEFSRAQDFASFAALHCSAWRRFSAGLQSTPSRVSLYPIFFTSSLSSPSSSTNLGLGKTVDGVD